ncbi:unnamed protein product [Cylindrotheca closterium]|uniref:N-acetylgalactosaminide beta-1,3-galactosyltransferase n=1 Tax=Cylindrotheca closterium TaxID=2856 RepID=A0AAD2FAI3_9STRA|nr:unnamed protein product [Cylindrotheca closterium]
MADKTIPPSHVKQSPSTTKRKPKSKSTTPNTNDFLCKKLHKSPVFQQIQIANSKNKASPKILCFIMSHSKATTKINAVLKTWGRKCDKLLIASNETDSRIGAVKMNSEASYLGLWNKLNETMTYIWNEFGADQFEWVLKADDDTFVIMENLKEYLSSLPSTRMSSQPSIHGRRFSSPKYKHLERDEYFTNPQNVDFGKRFYAKMDRNAPVIYNHGGSAYVMNMGYVQKFVEVMHGPDTVHGTPAEDMAHGVVMAYHDLWPTNTRDELGRERFHPKDPQLMYNMPEDKFRLFNDNHQPTGGLSVGVDCCSEKSITFHHIKPSNMIALERVFYTCRGL